MYVSIDAQGLEWRVAVALSNDPVGIKEINNKEDIHTNNQKTFSLPTRLVSKVYLFRTIYRGSGYSFSLDPDFSGISNDPKYWDNINEQFYKKYQGLDAWHLELGRTVASRKPIITPFGREFMIPLRPDGKLPWPTLTNYPVQGTGADIVSIARVSLRNRLKGMRLTEVLPVSTVHDSIVLDLPSRLVDTIGKLATEVFLDLNKNVERLFKVRFPIDFPGEVSYGPNLADLKTWEPND